VIKLITVIIEA